MTSFQDFGLAEPIARALVEEKYETPTPIQAQTVPLALAGRDVIGIAQTGTGKTAAFALPILQRLHTNPRPTDRKTCRVLVLSPTRELSGQILDSFRAYGRHLRLSSDIAIGGVSMGRQVRALLNGLDVLVATPGRLLDLVHSNALRLSGVEVLVLDEADRMLDMGFIHDIRKIVAKLPKERQTLFFSATMPQAIAELAQDMLRDPARVAVTPVATTAERIDQRIVRVDKPAKPAVLADILRSEPIDRCLVFTRTKHGADKVVRGLAKAGIGAEAIHGNKSQNQRERVLAAFRAGDTRILVATDIAARGIDVEGVSHVINFDLPNIPESYVHRIGRTARAGAEGIAISFCDAEEVAYLRDIEKLIRMRIPATERRAGHPQGAVVEASEPRPAAAPARQQQSRRAEPHRDAADPRRNGGEPRRDRPNRNRQEAAGQRNGQPTQRRDEQPAPQRQPRTDQQPRQPHGRGAAQPQQSRGNNGPRGNGPKPQRFDPVRVGKPLPHHSAAPGQAAVETALDSVAFLRRDVQARRPREQRPVR